MNRAFVILAGTVAVGIVSGAGWRNQGTISNANAGERTEVIRLRAHFDSVDTELRSRELATLSASQRVERTRLIGWLREYRNAGRFPINDRFPNRMVPFFRDSRGTLCAMAYLIARSGRTEIVDRIAAERNNAYIAQLTDDPALVSWLAASGLSVSEAARIQPEYGGNVITEDQRDKLKSSYALLSIGLGAAAGGATGANLVAPSRTGKILGFVFGTADFIAGIMRVDENKGTKKVAIADMGIGAVSIIGALYSAAKTSHAKSAISVSPERAGILSGIRLVPDVAMVAGGPRYRISAARQF